MSSFLLSLSHCLLREYSPRDGMLIGRSQHCDIVIPDASVPSKAFIVESDGDDFRLRDAAVPARTIPFSPGDEVRLGTYLLRSVEEGVGKGCTHGLAVRDEDDSSYALVVGRGKRARRFVLNSTPLRIGSAPKNDVCLDDRTVSANHCELEASTEGVLIRDIGSRNGTWVDGRRVLSALEVTGGFELRVGCTDLSVVPRGRPSDLDRFVVQSAPMVELMSEAKRYAVLPYPVLVLGESGAGKEGVSRSIHDLSSRSDGPFVALNAGAIPPTLIESELFGHEKGAFTGAHARRKGAFEAAEGGTLFLDEIGELPLLLQTRLLRVLETWTVRPLGSDRERPVDVRLVCATNRQPSKLVASGALRRDLFHRLGRLTLQIPPLRERVEDIEPLARLFLMRFEEVGGPRRFEPSAIRFFEKCAFMGNVRELRNVVEGAAALSDYVVSEAMVRRAYAQSAAPPPPSDEALAMVLRQYGGNISAAARATGMPRETLRDRLRRHRKSDAAPVRYDADKEAA